MASVLSQYDKAVIEQIESGKSGREVSNWLLTMGIKISHQAISGWYNRRIEKTARLAKKRNAIFESSPILNKASDVVILKDRKSNPGKSLGQIIEKSEMKISEFGKTTANYFPLPIKSMK